MLERWALERGAKLCGQDPIAGLVADFNGRVTGLKVNFHVGGE